MLDLGPLVLGTVLTLAAVIAALVVSRRADSEWAPVAVVGGGTVLGLAALGLAIAVTRSATGADNPTPPSTESALLAATPTASPSVADTAAVSTPTSTPALETATATPPPTETPTPAARTPTPTSTPAPAATRGIAGPPPTRYVAAAEGGVRWRSACTPEALLAGWWPNGTSVEVMRESPENCAGWSLVRSGSLVSWVNDASLADAPPEAAAPVTSTATPLPPTSTPQAATTPDATATPAQPTPTPTPPPVVAGQRGSYADALGGWISRLRDIETALDSNFDRAVASSDWASSSTNATRLATAAVTVRTEIEQTAPFVAELAPDCHDAMAPLGEMAEALVRMASAHQEWLAGGLVDNEAGLRVSALRDTLRAAESSATAALDGCA